MSHRTSTSPTSGQASGKRPKSEQNFRSRSDKCVGNNYLDLDADTRKLVDEQVVKDLKTLHGTQRNGNIADISLRDRNESPLENAKYCFSNKVKTNKAFLTRVKHDRTMKQMGVSVTVAENYALADEKPALNNKHFDFVPVQVTEGKSKYVINNSTTSHMNGAEAIQIVTHWKGHQAPSHAPLIALQRSKTIFRNQYLPSIQNTKQNSPPRNQHNIKVMVSAFCALYSTCSYSYTRLLTFKIINMPLKYLSLQEN